MFPDGDDMAVNLFIRLGVAVQRGRKNLDGRPSHHAQERQEHGSFLGEGKHDGRMG
jgi:hypothetical protein